MTTRNLEGKSAEFKLGFIAALAYLENAVHEDVWLIYAVRDVATRNRLSVCFGKIKNMTAEEALRAYKVV